MTIKANRTDITGIVHAFIGRNPLSKPSNYDGKITVRKNGKIVGTYTKRGNFVQKSGILK